MLHRLSTCSSTQVHVTAETSEKKQKPDTSPDKRVHPISPCANRAAATTAQFRDPLTSCACTCAGDS
jgi:hypothetical protein